MARLSDAFGDGWVVIGVSGWLDIDPITRERGVVLTAALSWMCCKVLVDGEWLNSALLGWISSLSDDTFVGLLPGSWSSGFERDPYRLGGSRLRVLRWILPRPPLLGARAGLVRRVEPL